MREQSHSPRPRSVQRTAGRPPGRGAGGFVLGRGVDPGEGLPVNTNEEARDATDEAIVAFRAHIERAGGATEAAYRPVIAKLDGLAAVRESIDAYKGPAVLADGNVEAAIAPACPTEGLDLANEVYLDYTALIAVLRRQHADRGPRRRDRLRNGTDLVNLAARQTDLAGNLLRVTARAEFTGEGIDPRTELPEVATLLGEYERQDDQIRRLATGSSSRSPTRCSRPSGSSGSTRSSPGRWRRWSRPGRTARRPAVVRQRRVHGLPRRRGRGAGHRGRPAGRRSRHPRAAVPAARRPRARRRLRHHLADRPVDHPAAADAHRPGQGRRRAPAARRPARGARPAARRRGHPGRRARAGRHPRRGRRRGRRHQLGAGHGRRPRRRAGRAAAQHLRRVREPRAAQPEPAHPPARLHHPPGVRRDRPRHAGQPVPARPPRHPHAPQRREPARLAGAQPSRRWSAPIPVKDVMRAALGEVEGYERVELSRVDPATVVGATAAELAHLVAELLENALAFSPPDRSVLVQGVGVPEGTCSRSSTRASAWPPPTWRPPTAGCRGPRASRSPRRSTSALRRRPPRRRPRRAGAGRQRRRPRADRHRDAAAERAGRSPGRRGAFPRSPRRPAAGPAPARRPPTVRACPSRAGAGAGAGPGAGEAGWLPRSAFVPASAVEGPGRSR